MSRTPTRRLALLLAAAALGLTACGGASAELTPAAAGSSAVELRYQGSANTVTLPELAADLDYLGDVKLTWVGNTTSGPQDIQSAATDQTDFGGAFDGAIAKLVAAGAPIKAVVSYYGADEKTYQGYFVKDDSGIRTARDLIGKKIAVNTLGAHHEAVIDSYLRKNGLTDEEVKQVELVVVPPVNGEQALRQGQVDVTTLGGVLQDKAAERGGLHPLFTDQELFGSFNGGSYVLREELIEKNPEVAKAFVTGVAKAIEWLRTTPREQVIARYTKIIESRGRNEDTSALKYWKSSSVPTKGGLIVPEDFTRWFPWLERNGQLRKGVDPESLYTNQFNPFAGEQQ